MVVEALDVVKDICPDLIARFVVALAGVLRLHREEEALHRCIVPAVPASAGSGVRSFGLFARRNLEFQWSGEAIRAEPVRVRVK